MMERGKTYDLFYEDDTRVRKKTIILEEIKEGMIFYTAGKGLEGVPLSRVLRIKGSTENESTQEH